MNQYGTKAKKHWQQWLPKRYSQIKDPDQYFDDLGIRIAMRVEELMDAIAGDDPPGEGYLQKVQRLNMARFDAESDVLREMALLPPEADEEETPED